MAEITITIDGVSMRVPEGATVAAALLAAGRFAFRRSPGGEPRGPLCGMGVCFECRVTIDGRAHERACQLLCRDHMQVTTDAPQA